MVARCTTRNICTVEDEDLEKNTPNTFTDIPDRRLADHTSSYVFFAIRISVTYTECLYINYVGPTCTVCISVTNLYINKMLRNFDEINYCNVLLVGVLVHCRVQQMACSTGRPPISQ